MDELIGKIVTKISVADQGTEYPEGVLIFETDSGKMHYVTDADCCSETWFADITGVDALLGVVVKDAVRIDLDEPKDGRTRQEEDQAYGVKITTERGVCDIVYRNSSNGYYGGGCSLAVDYNGATNVREITDDWSA